MRVLILGCGYVGAALAEQLLQRGAEVHATRRQAGEPTPPSLARAHWLTVDVTRPETMAPLAQTWDAVINGISSSRGGVDVYRKVFLEAAIHLGEIFAAHPPGLYVHLSSTSVYGQTDGGWVTEDSPTQPDSETARLLVATEQTWRSAGAKGLPVTILRLAGIYGPARCYWLNQFLAGQARLDEHSRRYLNMIHREDAAQAIMAALERPGLAAGRIFNVADDSQVTVRELYQWLAEALQRPLPPETDRAADAPRKRAVTNKRVSNARLKAELGWRPRYPTYREGFLEEIQRLRNSGALES